MVMARTLPIPGMERSRKEVAGVMDFGLSSEEELEVLDE
jgi:hypothetical protein